MTPRRNTLLATVATLLLPVAMQFTLARAQAQTGADAPEGLIPTQMLIRPDSKQEVVPMAQNLVLELDKRTTSFTSLQRVQPNGTQIALLIDDGLSRSAGIQLNDIKQFIQSLPAGTELLIGYMQNGRVLTAAPFSTDRQAALAALRLPQGVPGESASPYFCLSDFVKHWPGSSEEGGAIHEGKARFVLMITNGVDPYNGSTSILNQDSPYVQSAVYDAQRAGVAVSSIYYRDAGFRGGRGSFSGQSYLQQVADGTGGDLYYEGLGSPVSLAPFFKQFMHAISETYVGTFGADAQGGGREHLLRAKLTSTGPKLKFRYPDEIRPGNREANLPSTAMAAPAQE